MCFSFSKLPVCFRDLLCPPVTDGRGVAIGVVVEWKVMTALDSDCGHVAKYQSEALLPAQRIVLAPEERQDGNVGELGLQLEFELAHQRIDPDQFRQNLLCRVARGAGSPGSEEGPSIRPAQVAADAPRRCGQACQP